MNDLRNIEKLVQRIEADVENAEPDEASCRNEEVLQSAVRGIREAIDAGNGSSQLALPEPVGISWLTQIESLIDSIYNIELDPVVHVELMLRLLQHGVEGEHDFERAAGKFLEFLTLSMNYSSHETIVGILRELRARSFPGHRDAQSQELVCAYEERARAGEGLPPLMARPDPGKEERCWFSEPNTPSVRIPKEVPAPLLPPKSISAPGEAPVCVIVTGPIASGKSRYRHAEFSGFVAIDPPDVYRFLTSGNTAVPENIGHLLQTVGRGLARKAINERRNIIFEVVPTEEISPAYEETIGRLKGAGYRIRLMLIDADLQVAEARNRMRGLTNVSCWFAEADTIEWLDEGMKAAVRGVPAEPIC